MKGKKNKRYNRIEHQLRHEYLNYFDGHNVGSSTHSGFIKCKLVHAHGYSVIVPDQIYLRGAQIRWIQPLFFDPNRLSKTDDDIYCEINLHISLGKHLLVRFKSSDYIRRFNDGSEIYRCQIQGPPNLSSYATGTATIDEDFVPYLTLYHHTTDTAKKSIISSSEYWSSAWNIQGTKQFDNIRYVYFTCLHEIKKNEDLIQIGMANDGAIYLKKDNAIDNSPNSVIKLNVYREKTSNRCHVLTNKVQANLLASQPIWKHRIIGEMPYYEFVQPFIYRIGVKPEAVLPITDNQYIKICDANQALEYLVLGDANTLDGLAAPYDEEYTKEIFKVEFISGGSNILNFWFQNSNKDLFTPKVVEKAAIKQV